MNKNIKRLTASAAALLIGTSAISIPAETSLPLDVSAAQTTNVLEYLDKGVCAVNTGSGMLVSWRFLANDDDNAVFNLYRDGELIYTSENGKSTCYLDKNGKNTSSYRVDTLSGGKVVSSDDCRLISNNSYFDIPLQPPTASGITYSPNDMSVGDIDGDGQYELFLKWDPNNSQDNSKGGVTGNVYIDCIRLDGTRVWRIDLGKNIRAGAHYTQFYVADFDLDGIAEMTCKTADGTVDGTGKVIGDASKDYRNSDGYILSGPEYYTLFDGATGAALDTIDYEPQRGEVSKWGDNYGNRVDRFNGAVVYLDGQKPSAVSNRGYYTRMTVVAYDVVDKKLVERWKYDSGNDAKKGYHNGNHNCMPADVDNDGKQELVLGSTCIDDDGSLLWCNNQGHGDAMHLGDFLPDREGLELWMCHENSPYGVSLIDAKTGKNIFHKDHSKDTGRACCGNIYSKNPGAEFWGATGNDIFDGTGKTISTTKPAQNFMIYWDGDLEREILDGTKIDDFTDGGKLNRLLTADGCAANNGSKNNPGLAADIMGDWREELVVRTSDSKYLRVYNTKYTTNTRLTTLMHDPQYRCQAAGEQNCYNQPAHPSFYLGSDEKLPERPKVTLNKNGSSAPIVPSDPIVTTTTNKVDPIVTTTTAKPVTPVEPSQLEDGAVYMIKNKNSGLYMEVENQNGANSVNVQQASANGAANGNSWKAVSAGNGYYYLYTQLGDGKTYVLDISGKKTDDGTNVEIYTYKGGDNQQFKFVKNDDGTYTILSKITGDASAVEVNGKSTESGANIQQWAANGGDNQKWILEKANGNTQVTTQPTTTTTSKTTTTTATTTTTTQPPVGNKVLGDANNDGKVLLNDAVIILQHLGNPDAYPLSDQARANADVCNPGDGITNKDALAIQRYILKVISNLPDYS